MLEPVLLMLSAEKPLWPDFKLLIEPLSRKEKPKMKVFFVCVDRLKITVFPDTIGNFQRPVFSLGVSQHMHDKTNLWKYELNWSSKLQENNGRKKAHVHQLYCAFRCLIFRPQNQTPGLEIKWSCFSQCFILSTALHYL